MPTGHRRDELIQRPIGRLGMCLLRLPCLLGLAPTRCLRVSQVGISKRSAYLGASLLHDGRMKWFVHATILKRNHDDLHHALSPVHQQGIQSQLVCAIEVSQDASSTIQNPVIDNFEPERQPRVCVPPSSRLFLHEALPILQTRSEPSTESPSLTESSVTLPAWGALITIS